MGNVLAGMAMSLDGFIEDRNGSVARLYPDDDLYTLRRYHLRPRWRPG